MVVRVVTVLMTIIVISLSSSVVWVTPKVVVTLVVRGPSIWIPLALVWHSCLDPQILEILFYFGEPIFLSISELSEDLSPVVIDLLDNRVFSLVLNESGNFLVHSLVIEIGSKIVVTRHVVNDLKF